MTTPTGFLAELTANAGRIRLIDEPAGYSTSSALREYAAQTGAVYLALPKRTSFARFAGDLVEAFEPKSNGIARTFTGAFARALQKQDPPAALAAWFLRNAGSNNATIVLAGLHRADDPRVARFVTELVERSPANLSFVIAAQSLDELPVSTWLVRGVATRPIDASRFTDSLEREPADVESVDVVRVASECERDGDIAGALQLLIWDGREDEAVAVIERHGFALVENDRSHLLHDALTSLSDDARKKSAVVLALLAIAASLVDRHDVSESFFKNALTRCDDEGQLRHIQFMFGRSLLRRGRPDGLALFEEVAMAADLPQRLRIANNSALAAAYAFAGRNDEAQASIETTLHSARQSGDDVLIARVLHQAAFVALRGARYAEAKGLAIESVTLAERIGLHETIAGASSVLYNVALDVEEDLSGAAAELRRIAECGAKCGNVDKQLYGLIAGYEIEAERGDEAALAALESDLGEFDIAFGDRVASEALLPAQVLQLAWHGEFSRAYQILKVSADGPGDPGRRALRWAEIAVYAAATRETTEAMRALAASKEHLKSVPLSSVHGIRTAAYLALAQVLLGRPQSARTEIASLNGNVPAGSGRLRALVEFTRRLIGWHVGSTDHLDLLASLEHLRASQFGGFARMLEALPADLLEPEPADPRKAKSA